MSAPFTLSNPEWFAHRFVESDDTIRFVALCRAEHGSMAFLTDEHLGSGRASVDVPVEECLAGLAKGPLRFLFHSAFCGSTLLARAFDCPGLAMGLSEPLLFNDVVGFRRRGADPRAVARVADAACRLTARPFGPGEAVVVKPSNVINPLAELLAMLNPQAPALFLFAPLETFLISVARKGLACRLWVRELAEGYLREGFIDLGFTPEDFFRHTDLQVAAIGWMAQHAHFARLGTKLGPERLRSLDADAMTAAPAEAVFAVAQHFTLPLDRAAAEKVAAGPAFTRHSKSGAAFTPKDRTAEYAEARRAYGSEIDLVLEWSAKVMQTAGIDAAAPYPLLSSP